MSPERIRPGSARRLEQRDNGTTQSESAAPGDEQLAAPSMATEEHTGGQDQLEEDRLEHDQLTGESDLEVNHEITDQADKTADANAESDTKILGEETIEAPSGPRRPRTTATSSPPAESATPPRHGAFRRLYFGETHFDFVRRRHIWFAVSLAIILAGIISLSTRGLNLGIDFVGGTAWTIPAGKATPTSVQSALAAKNITGATVVKLGTPATHSQTIEVELKLNKGQQATSVNQNEVTDLLANATGKPASDVSIQSVGPSWGGQVTHKAIIALIVFFVLIALYISIFFEWRMALAAIAAVIHDILVTVGIYSLTGFEVTPDTVVAILTILGYSLYDTIVVFDRVRDNVRHLSIRDRLTFSDVVNLSMNQTLARSINTSLVAILPILSLLILGADVLGATTLQYFGLALLVGLAAGAYSSIFIASPLVAMLKEREPRYRQLRERLALRGADRVLLSAAAIASGSGLEDLGGSPSPTKATSSPRRPRPAEPARSNGAAGQEQLTEAEDKEPAGPVKARPAGTPRPTRPSTRRPPARTKRKGGRR